MPLLGPIVKRAYELGRLPEIAKPKLDPYTQQKRVLKRLLRKAQFTAFGEHYGFSEILKKQDFVSAFQAKVPTFTYNPARYPAVLGEPKRARAHLRRAFSLDRSLRAAARADADLASLGDQF